MLLVQLFVDWTKRKKQFTFYEQENCHYLADLDYVPKQYSVYFKAVLRKKIQMQLLVFNVGFRQETQY